MNSVQTPQSRLLDIPDSIVGMQGFLKTWGFCQYSLPPARGSAVDQTWLDEPDEIRRATISSWLRRFDDRAHLGYQKMPFALALSSSVASAGMGFINWTPSFSAARLSSTQKGSGSMKG